MSIERLRQNKKFNLLNLCLERCINNFVSHCRTAVPLNFSVRSNDKIIGNEYTYLEKNATNLVIRLKLVFDILTTIGIRTYNSRMYVLVLFAVTSLPFVNSNWFPVCNICK